MPHQTVIAVLLIGDDLQFSYLIKRYGRSCGCQVVNVIGLDEAYSRVNEMRPALIVLHGLNVSADDWRVLRTLKRERGTCDIPVAVCLASVDEARAWEAGVDYWLTQPVLYEDFLAALAATGIAPSSDSDSNCASGEDVINKEKKT